MKIAIILLMAVCSLMYGFITLAFVAQLSVGNHVVAMVLVAILALALLGMGWWTIGAALWGDAA